MDLVFARRHVEHLSWDSWFDDNGAPVVTIPRAPLRAEPACSIKVLHPCACMILSVEHILVSIVAFVHVQWTSSMFICLDDVHGTCTWMPSAWMVTLPPANGELVLVGVANGSFDAS